MSRIRPWGIWKLVEITIVGTATSSKEEPVSSGESGSFNCSEKSFAELNSSSTFVSGWGKDQAEKSIVYGLPSESPGISWCNCKGGYSFRWCYVFFNSADAPLWPGHRLGYTVVYVLAMLYRSIYCQTGKDFGSASTPWQCYVNSGAVLNVIWSIGRFRQRKRGRCEAIIDSPSELARKPWGENNKLPKRNTSTPREQSIQTAVQLVLWIANDAMCYLWYRRHVGVKGSRWLVGRTWVKSCQPNLPVGTPA